jgi:Icc-related predicted phosphoesterase
VPVFAVRGNHDTVDEYRAFRSADDVTGRVAKLGDGLYVAGVGWRGELYYELPTESDLRSVCDAVERHSRRLVMPSDRLVLLTHYPPRLPGMREIERDVRDGGTWYDCVRELADAIRPVAIVQGHVHRWSGTSQTVEVAGRPVLVFHPGRHGGALLIDEGTGEASVVWSGAMS